MTIGGHTVGRQTGETNVPSSVIVIAVIIAVIVIGSWSLRLYLTVRRRKERMAFAADREWEYLGDQQSFADQFQGPPFRAWGRGRVHDLMAGRHRDRNIWVFEYEYTEKDRDDDDRQTTRHHHHMMWVVGLPCAMPDLEVRPEGLLGGRVASALGFQRIRLDRPDFDADFLVKSSDEAFARRVLTPEVADRHLGVRDFDWRFEGMYMVSFEDRRLELDRLMPHLDMMCDILDRMPADVWA